MSAEVKRPLRVVREEDVPCPMRDGTILRADVYRPRAGDRFPALLCRTPYDKRSEQYASVARALARRGYVAIVQDIRGRCRSEGEFQWCYGAPAQIIDAEDGYDTVEWAGALAICDGRVGTWGTSYPTWCSWRLAAVRPPALAALHASGIAPRMTVGNHGILDLGRRMQWAFGLSADARARAGEPFGPHERTEAERIWAEVFRDKWTWRVPLESIPEEVFGPLGGQMKQYFRDIATDHWRFDDSFERVEVPVGCMTSWWDRQALTVDAYAGMVERGPRGLRYRHRLLIGPWSHNTHRLPRKLGVRDYGPAAQGDFADILLEWYDREFKGVGAEKPPVKAFVLNDNAWRCFDRWPPAGTRIAELFLRSGGRANTVFGDGRLDWEAPEAESPDQFTFDSADPVMSITGPNTQHAPCDQAPLAGRDDVLVYQTRPLDRDLLLVGPLHCVLWAATDAPDTDFALKLVEVGRDGCAINLSFGIVRARYRGGPGSDEPMRPGEACEFVVTMMPVGIRLHRGSRLRLDVASSDFPNFDRNHNTGRDYWEDPELRVARQTVFHERRCPSRLLLPIVED